MSDLFIRGNNVMYIAPCAKLQNGCDDSEKSDNNVDGE